MENELIRLARGLERILGISESKDLKDARFSLLISGAIIGMWIQFPVGLIYLLNRGLNNPNYSLTPPDFVFPWLTTIASGLIGMVSTRYIIPKLLKNREKNKD